MTRPHSDALKHALKQTKRLAYGDITVGEAILAWGPWKNRWSYIREHYGEMVYQACSLAHAGAEHAGVWPIRNPTNKARREKEMRDLCAVIKAVLALIEGDIIAPEDQEAQRALLNASRTVVDFKSRAAGERDDDPSE